MMLDEVLHPLTVSKLSVRMLYPSSFTVWMLTKGGGGISSLVTTQLTVLPAVILPERPESLHNRKQ